jgi:hypothetical protein
MDPETLCREKPFSNTEQFVFTLKQLSKMIGNFNIFY